MLGECPQAHRFGRVARADDADRLRALSRAQHLAPGEQRVEDRVGQRRAPAHEATELGLGDHQHATRPADAAAQRAALAGQQVQLADEAAAVVGDDHDRLGAVEANDLDFALEDDEQVEGRLAGLEQQLPCGGLPLAAERGDFRELGRTQHRKGARIELLGGAHLGPARSCLRERSERIAPVCLRRPGGEAR